MTPEEKLEKVNKFLATWFELYDPEKIEKEWDCLDLKIAIISLNAAFHTLAKEIEYGRNETSSI